MPHISTFIDRPTKLGARQVQRSNIGFSAVGTTEHGTLNLAKAIGTLSSIDIGSAIFSYGSAGTFAGRVARFGYGSFTGTLSAPLLRAQRLIISGTISSRVGSFGTYRGQLEIGRFGSYSGTVVSPVFRGRYGSLSGTFRAPVIRGRLGTLFGTFSAHKIFGSVGSFTRVPGAASNLKNLGTHLAGSWSGNEVRNRYAVWASPFGDTAYRVWFGLDVGSIGSNFNVTPGRAHFMAGATRRSPGSVKYYLGRNAGPDASGTLRSIGSLYILGMPNG